MKVPFSNFFGRITGISTPVLGVSWTPPAPEQSIVSHLITFLEDRRVLYSPYQMEVVSHCISSIMDIRRQLTHELGQLKPTSELHATLSIMRATCRKFLDTLQQGDIIDGHLYCELGMAKQWVFGSALGELRGIFGVHIAYLAAKYQVDVEEQLVTIFPPADEPTAETDDELRFLPA